MLVSVPALRSLRAGYPESEITLIGLPWAAEFARRLPLYVDRFVPFPGYPGLTDADVDAQSAARFIEEQRAYGYDLVVQLHGSGVISSPLAVKLGGSKTAGFYDTFPPVGLDVAVRYPYAGHEIDRNLALVRELGCPDTGRHLELKLLPEDEESADDILQMARASGRTLIGLHPGSSLAVRRWPARYFAEAADEIADRCNGHVVITGSSTEKETADTVENALRAPVTNVAGSTSIGSLAGIISRVSLFVANDTGPAHVAVAMNTPSITIFGPGETERWAPIDANRHPIVRYPVRCSPCRFVECPIDRRCLERLAPSAVWQKAVQLLR